MPPLELLDDEDEDDELDEDDAAPPPPPAPATPLELDELELTSAPALPPVALGSN